MSALEKCFVETGGVREVDWVGGRGVCGGVGTGERRGESFECRGFIWYFKKIKK